MSLPTPDSVGAIRREILAWYHRHRRILPWRDAGGGPMHPDPYAVWISEVMLQQTQVGTVVPYFKRWMAHFPDAAALAAAPLAEVLAQWQGLGYYARARNLHRAAQAIVARHDGRLPADVDALRRLPGIGDYTAGAIASIAFGLAEPAVDGNARRVLARVGAIEGDPARGVAVAAIRSIAATLAVGPTPGDLNQALMELGATVCLPRRPDCPACPIAAHCLARRDGREGELPAPGARARQREERVWAFAVHCVDPESPKRDLWLIARRPPTGLLGGLWEFPLVPAAPGDGDPAAACRHSLGLASRALTAGPSVKHVFTHIRLTADVVVGDVMIGVDVIGDNGEDARMPDGSAGAYSEWAWVTWAGIGGGAYPVSTLMRKLMAAVAAGGNDHG